MKAASAAVLGVISVAASLTSGASRADENVPTVTTTQSLAPSLSSSADTRRAIVFGAPGEVVQPLPAPQADTPVLPNGGHNSLAALVGAADVTTPLDEQSRCLAVAVFHEARSESLEGQLAVARVIINRAASSRFSDDICGVVRQPGQFSFVRRGVIPSVDTGRASWRTAIAISRVALQNGWASEAEGALYFHARRVSPAWTHKRMAVIDNHIFYR